MTVTILGGGGAVDPRTDRNPAKPFRPTGTRVTIISGSLGGGGGGVGSFGGGGVGSFGGGGVGSFGVGGGVSGADT